MGIETVAVVGIVLSAVGFLVGRALRPLWRGAQQKSCGNCDCGHSRTDHA